MTPKIAILGTGDETTGTDVPDVIRTIQLPPSVPVLEPVPGVVFPDTPENREIAIDAYVACGQRLAAEGYAALYINTMGDYGLDELRRALDIPVTGSGEASILAAKTRGARFSVVTIWPRRLKFIYDHVLADSEAVAACQNIHFLSEDDELQTMGQGDDFYSNMRTCQITSMTRIRQTIERSLERDNVDSVILGCTCMSHLGPILEDEGYPVIEPIATGYRHAVALAHAKKT